MRPGFPVSKPLTCFGGVQRAALDKELRKQQERKKAAEEKAAAIALYAPLLLLVLFG